MVQTEKKGFGLRAEEDLPRCVALFRTQTANSHLHLDRDGFIMEYVGDVVNEKAFKKRMRDYADEGIKHFYFMMLQKGEFIDATKAGGIGRFANHSCAPNCYVGKWTIGKSVRMGIFAKRAIKRHEELTFDYNVDRYGHEAQKCWCGEPECVGFIGGKTQTVSDDTLAALGIDIEDVDQPELKLKKRKGKGLGRLEELSPLEFANVPKVLQAIRQNMARPDLLLKLLKRVQITEDPAVLRQVMRLRALTLFKSLLEDALGIVPPEEKDEEEISGSATVSQEVRGFGYMGGLFVNLGSRLRMVKLLLRPHQLLVRRLWAFPLHNEPRRRRRQKWYKQERLHRPRRLDLLIHLRMRHPLNLPHLHRQTQRWPS